MNLILNLESCFVGVLILPLPLTPPMGGQIIGPTLFGPTLQQTDLSTDRMVFGPMHVF